MAVISINIINSDEYLIAGIPTAISLSTNIPATIFFTTDGSTPTTFSSVYTSEIEVPQGISEFILKVFATDGVNTSSVITQIYKTNILNNTRLPHAPLASSSKSLNSGMSMFPFGSNSPTPTSNYLNNSVSGITVSNPLLPTYTYGYDAENNPVGANKPLEEYTNVYSKTDSQNKSYPGVGNLPGTVTILGRRSPSEYAVQSSNRNSGLFDPKAMVIFQDASDEDPSNPTQINPQFFSLENYEIVKDGSPLRATKFEGPLITGSFIRSYYNPSKKTITAYYRDSGTNKWIISTFPYDPSMSSMDNLSNTVRSKHDNGAGKIFTWNLFRYRTLT